MNKLYILFTLCLGQFYLMAQPQWQWAQKTGYVSSVQQPRELCTDTAGNVYALSVNTGTASYSSTTLDSGTVLVKYNKLGNEIWARQLSFRPGRISCDDQSNIYLTSSWYTD